MKRIFVNIFTVLFLAGLACSAAARSGGYGRYRGVWANEKSEVVITDSLMMYFTQDTTTGYGYASLRVPTRNLAIGVTFAKDTALMGVKLTKDTVLIGQPRDCSLKFGPKGTLDVDGERMTKVECVDIVKPYDMPYATGRDQVGRCLQEWQLGAQVDNDGEGYVQAMVGTNRNSFMFAVTDRMVYLRAAALLHCDDGSLFIQNIRMMKNLNTGEFSNEHMANNLAFLTRLPPIDRSKFSPDRCVFAENCQIYWSYISHTPEEIKLNGCGDVYIYKRPHKENDTLMEWIKYSGQ